MLQEMLESMGVNLWNTIGVSASRDTLLQIGCQCILVNYCLLHLFLHLFEDAIMLLLGFAAVASLMFQGCNLSLTKPFASSIFG